MERPGLTRRWRTVGLVLATVALAVVVRTQFLDVASVSSDSMAPTVCTGDTVLLARLGGGAKIEVDDIITFANPGDGSATIKRVVALGGQSVAIRDAQLEVDGRPVNEPYVDLASIDGVYFGPVTVPAGSIFVLGDHREISIDSRAYGAIPRSAVQGRLLSDLWSNCDAAAVAQPSSDPELDKPGAPR